MFFAENEINAELLGVFKISREKYINKKAYKRSYDSLSIRLSGRGQFETVKETFTVKKGNVLYIPKNADYTQKSDGEKIIAIHFINSNSSGNKPEVITAEDIGYVEALFCRIYDVWKEKKQGHKYKCSALLYEILYILNCQEHSKIIQSVSGDSKIKLAIDYIHSNYRSNNTIEIKKLAEMCCVSETYFRKLFKKIHGVSPVQYTIDLKLEFASHLLRSQHYTINEVAYKSGFCDSKYFSKLFKKRYNCSPKVFQNNNDI